MCGEEDGSTCITEQRLRRTFCVQEKPDNHLPHNELLLSICFSSRWEEGSGGEWRPQPLTAAAPPSLLLLNSPARMEKNSTHKHLKCTLSEVVFNCRQICTHCAAPHNWLPTYTWCRLVWIPWLNTVSQRGFDFVIPPSVNTALPFAGFLLAAEKAL